LQWIDSDQDRSRQIKTDQDRSDQFGIHFFILYKATIMSELPIYIPSTQTSDLFTYDDPNSGIERKPLRPEEVWLEYSSIDVITLPAQTTYPGTLGTKIRGVKDLQLVQEGNSLFSPTTPSNLAFVLSGTIKNVVFKPTIRDSLNADIPYNPSVWIIDNILYGVDFKYKTPQQLGYTLPIYISFYYYTGAIATVPAAPLALHNQVSSVDVYNAGISTTTDAYFRSFAVDTTGGLSIIADTPSAGFITASNTMTGANVGGGTGTVFRDRTTGTLNYKTISGTADITITNNTNTIGISLSNPITSGTFVINWGGTFVDTTLSSTARYTKIGNFVAIVIPIFGGIKQGDGSLQSRSPQFMPTNIRPTGFTSHILNAYSASITTTVLVRVSASGVITYFGNATATANFLDGTACGNSDETQLNWLI
jgi:hypothetical protein